MTMILILTLRLGVAKRYLRNPANTFSYQEIGSAITANRTVTEPLLTGNDTRVYQAHTQTLTNKTISGASNTLSNIPVNSLSNFAISSPTTNQVIQYNGTSWVNGTITGGGTGGGGGMATGGTAIGSGNASTTVFTIAHGLSPQPDLYWAEAASDDAISNRKVTIDATNIIITYAIPPPGTGSSNNLTFHWAAGYINAASGGLTPSSTTTLTNKSLSYTTNAIGIAAFKAILSQGGSTFYCRSTTGSLIASGTVPETVFQATLDQGGLIVVMGGTTWNFSAAFTGLNMHVSNTHLIMNGDTVLRVPNGYTGNCFTVKGITENIRNCIIEGGKLTEQGAGVEQRLWTGISLETGLIGAGPYTTGPYFNNIRNIEIIAAGRGLRLYNHHDDNAVNSNYFENIVCTWTDIGFDFDSSYPTTNSGMGHNVFINCASQPFNPTYPCSYGFKDVCEGPVTFINCCSWDQTNPATMKTMTIKSTSNLIKIIGGIIDRTGGYFVDNSMHNNTLILQGHSGAVKCGSVGMVPSSFSEQGRRIGRYEVLSATKGSGFLIEDWTNFAGEASSVQTLTGADGMMYRRRTTGAVVNNGAGNKYAISPGSTCRQWNPVLRCRFRLNQTGTLQRVFIGYVGGTADRSGDDMLSGQYGVMLTLRSSDTVFQIAYNDAAGVTDFQSTGVAVDASHS